MQGMQWGYIVDFVVVDVQAEQCVQVGEGMEMGYLVFGETQQLDRDQLLDLEIFGVVELLQADVFEDERFYFVDALLGVPEHG